jgi:NAD(P)-dependent dehydrogenase (short-subunit alcohol dehydrogenase family)/carbon monoxide dehydrogenase subunit G
MSQSFQLKEQFVVNRSIEQVFDYLADFSQIADWDPSVLTAKKISQGAIQQGTQFDLVLKSAGRRVPMAYQLTDYQTNKSLTFVGKADGFTATDNISLQAQGTKTQITWQADLEFTGVLQYFIPAMRQSLVTLGKDSMQGLAKALADNYPVPTLPTKSLSHKLVLPALWPFTKYGYLQAKKNWQPVSASVKNKHIVITGASAGLGLATAKALAAKACQLTLVMRDPKKAAEVQKTLIAQTGNPHIEIEIANLSVMAEVMALSQRLKQKAKTIDVLINNAGALFNPRQENKEGLEQSFALLLLSPFILTEQLKPLLIKGSRVINVLSGGMYSQKIDVTDLENKGGNYSGSVAYAKAKRGLMISTEQWAHDWQHEGICVHAMHPGWAETTGVIEALPEFYKISKPFLRSPEQGADTIIWLATATEVGKCTGLFWLDRQAQPTHLLAKTQETQTERQQLRQALLAYQQQFS